MVPKENVQNTWPSIESYMQGAARYTHGRFTSGDILDQVMYHEHDLWLAFNDEGIKGAVVTSFTVYPRKKFLSMVFTGGIELNTWKDPMLSLLRGWAKANSCDGIESTGRPGWAKIFKYDGHNIVWHTYELPLDTGE